MNSHLVIWLDADDYRHLRRAYSALHLNPSQIVRIAVDRYLNDPNYRPRHPFATPAAVDTDDWSESEGRALNGKKISIRIERSQRERLKNLLAGSRFSMGAFCRGAIMEPGIVLSGDYIQECMELLVVERNVEFWLDVPV